jgi:hypothetical protein
MGNAISHFPSIEHATGDNRVWINFAGGAEAGNGRYEEKLLGMKQPPDVLREQAYATTR